MMVFKTKEGKLTWLAALIDGEGSIYLSKYIKHKNIYQELILSISNTNLPLLKTVKKILNKGLIKQKRDSRSNRKAQYIWIVKGGQALDIINTIQPWLINKSRHVKVAQKFRATIHAGPAVKPRRLSIKERQIRQRCWEEMKNLNKKGPR